MVFDCDRYRAIVPLLKKIEDAVLGTNTGAAPSLATYYAYWEQKIFKAITLMALNGLGTLQQLFRESLERKVNLHFTCQSIFIRFSASLMVHFAIKFVYSLRQSIGMYISQWPLVGKDVCKSSELKCQDIVTNERIK